VHTAKGVWEPQEEPESKIGSKKGVEKAEVDHGRTNRWKNGRRAEMARGEN
jgi:hypothetical protein